MNNMYILYTCILYYISPLQLARTRGCSEQKRYLRIHGGDGSRVVRLGAQSKSSLLRQRARRPSVVGAALAALWAVLAAARMAAGDACCGAQRLQRGDRQSAESSPRGNTSLVGSPGVNTATRGRVKGSV